MERSETAYRVIVEKAPSLPVPCQLAVETRFLDLSRIVCGRLLGNERMRLTMPETHYRERPGAFARAEFDLWACEPSPKALLSMVAGLKNRRATYIFTPESIGDGTTAMMAASLGVPVLLASREGWPEEVLLRLLDYFLHSPTLESPIEPFFSITQSLGGQAVALWDVYGERIGKDWYVDAQGRVTLSERHARRGEFFGVVEERVETLRASALYQAMAGRKMRAFAAPGACAFCAQYPWCQGYWAGPEACNSEPAWMNVMERLRQTFSITGTQG